MMSGVGIRLAFMMVLALLPLGLISVAQTQNLIAAGERAALSVAMGETVSASSKLVNLISESQAMVRTLAVTTAPYTEDRPTCERMMKAAAMLVPQASLVAYIPLNGQMTCSNTGRSYDFSNSTIFHDLINRPEPGMFISPTGPLTGTPVLGLSYPVMSSNQEFTGIVTVSLPQDVITPDLQSSRQSAAFYVFDRTGALFSAVSPDDLVMSHLPRDRTLSSIAGENSASFIGEDRGGEDRMFTSLPIEGSIYILASWPLSSSADLSVNAVHPYLLPMLMWIAGLAMAFLAAERLVVRHLRRLSRDMAAFARGQRDIAPVLDNPPSEIAQLASDYTVMTRTILREEASKEALLRQKAELLREVHHRTGNSLQLIASILRMHLREDPDEETRNLLENIHDRVMGLSTVHFGLYRMAGRSDIQMDTLLAEVIGKIGAIHGRYGRKDAITSALEPLVLQTQQAVPLALLVSEILSAFPATEAESDEDAVHITLRDVSDAGQEVVTAQLTISGDAGAYPTLKGVGSGVPEIIASRLIRAFVAQLDGSLDVGLSPDEAVVTATIRFTVQPPAPQSEAPSPLAHTI